MKTLSIDIETYSSAPLQKSGVYRYVEADDFEILLFGYSVDSSPVAGGRPCLRRTYPEGRINGVGGMTRSSNGPSMPPLNASAYPAS